MANRDEVINFLLNVKGAGDLTAVGAALRDAGVAGEEAKPEIEALVAELESLAAKNSAASNFTNLKTELAEVGVALSDAKIKAEDLTEKFGEAGPATAAEARQLANALIAVGNLTEREAQLTVELQKATESLEQSGIATNGIAEAQTWLGTQAALTAEKLRLVAEAAQLTGAAEEKEALKVEELAEKYRNLGQIIETLKGLVVTFGAIATFDKLKEGVEEVVATGDKLQKWQIQLTNLYGSVEQGHEAFEKLEEVAHNTPLTLSQVMESAISMKRQGLDPLNGTLETLIKANKAYGGSYDELSGVIDSFAKESAKGELSSRLLMQMQLAGIPAVRLLGEAMGKTEGQIRAMATAGDLGADAMGLLLEQLKKVGDNPAATGMTTIQAQVNSVKKSWEEFLDLIAKSGLYDYAKQEITEVATALKTALNDGEAKQKAQAISDAIVGIGKAAASIIGFLHDHAGAIKTIADAYALVRATQLAVDLVALAAKWKQSAVATLENAAAIQKNAAAQLTLTQEMAAATAEINAQTAATERNAVAMGAAAEGGLAKAIGSFGSLGNAAKGVGGIITSLVGGPIPAMAIAAAALIPVLESLVDKIVTEDAKLNDLDLSAASYVAATGDIVGAITQYRQSVDELNKSREEDKRQSDDLIARLKQKVAATTDAADTEVKAAKDVIAMTQEQRDEYAKSLQAAITYYTRLRVIAQADGKQTEVDEYNRKVKELSEALKDATTGFDEFREKAEKAADKAGTSVKALVDHIVDLHREGEAAPAAIEDAFHGLKIETPEGLRTFVGVLDGVKDLSGDVAEALKDGLAAELAKLDDLKFAQFKANLQAALNAGKISAEEYQQIIETIADADMLKLGLSAEQAGIKFSEAGGKIVAVFTDIANNATSTADQIHLAFAKALDQAQTEGEVEALKARLTDAFNAGRISAEQFADGMQSAKLRIDEIAAAAAKSNEALSAMGRAASDLGITLQADLVVAARKAKDAFDVIDQSSAQTASGLADRRAAFLAYAKTALDASAQLDKGTKDSVQYQLESKAASLGILDALKELEGQGKRTGDAIASGMDEAAEATRQAEQQAQRYNDAMATLRDTSASLEDKQKALAAAEENAASASQKAAAAAEGVESSMLAAMGAGQSLAQVMANSRAEFDGLTGALAEFDQGAQRAAQSSLSLSDYAAGLQTTYNDVRQKVDGVSASLQNQASILDTVGTDQDRFFNGTIAGADDAIAKLAYLKNSFQSVDDGFAKPEDIARFNQAMDGAISRMQALADAEKQAKDAFKSLSDQLQDQADQNAGNQEAVEDRRYQKQLADIKDAAAKAKELGSAQYQRDLANAEAIHQKNMADIAAEAAAKKSSASSSGSSSSSGRGVASPATAPGITYSPVYNQTFYGFGSEGMRDFARKMKVEFDGIARRSA